MIYYSTSAAKQEVKLWSAVKSIHPKRADVVVVLTILLGHPKLFVAHKAIVDTQLIETLMVQEIY